MGSELSLRDMCDGGALFLTDGYRTRRDQLSADGAPILRVAHVREGFIEVDKTDRISRDFGTRFARKTSQVDDVVITTKGTVGRAARISERFVGYVYSPQVCVLRVLNRGVLDPAWLYCWVRSPQFQDQLDLHSGQTDMAPYVKLKDLLGFGIAPPPIEEQRAIAEVLGALDDRVEWCGRAAALLHEFTRGAFRAWVADEGDERSIYEVAAVEYGAPYASARFNDQREGLPVIRIRDITADDAGMYTTERHARDVVIEPGDIVVGMDGEFRAHAWRGPRGLLNQRVCCFRPNEGVARTLVLHGLEAPLRFYEGSITGTTVIHLGKRHIDRFTMPFSPAGNEMMVRVADPMLDRAVTLAAEQRQLAALRDALLPRLLSGELRIEDPARVLGAVA